jgi:hypothetical protein
VVDLILQSRARKRACPHPLRLALVPAAAEAEAVVACTAAATVLRVEQEPGSTAQEGQYFEGVVDHGAVASVSSDQGLALGNKQKLTATCSCLCCKGGSGATGWQGIHSIGGSTYSSSSSSMGGGPHSKLNERPGHRRSRHLNSNSSIPVSARTGLIMHRFQTVLYVIIHVCLTVPGDHTRN